MTIFKNNEILIFILGILLTLMASLSIAYLGVYTLGLVAALLFLTFYLIYIRKTFWIVLILIPFLPNYLSFKVAESLPLISAFRLLLILFIFDQLLLKKRLGLFFGTIKNDRFKVVVFLYSFTLVTLGIVHLQLGDKTAFIGSISIVIEHIVLYYLVMMNMNIETKNHGDDFVNKFLSVICLSAFVLAVIGIIEYLTSFNVFTVLDVSNTKGVQSSTYFRQGELRVSTSFPHSLGYGLYLLLIIPIAYYQMKTQKHKTLFYGFLLILLVTNVFLTASRSTLLALGFAYLIFFLISNLKRKVLVSAAAIFIGLPILAFSITPVAENIPIVSTVGQNIKALSDAVFGTTYANDFGMNAEPFTYRETIVEYAFNQTGTDNIIGKGVGFIRTDPLIFDLPELNPYAPTISYSVDNYYVNVKLELGWIGLMVTMLLLGTVAISIFLNRKVHPFFLLLFIALSGYFFELIMVGDLGTMKYFWILLALYSSHLTYLSIKKKQQAAI